MLSLLPCSLEPKVPPFLGVPPSLSQRSSQCEFFAVFVALLPVLPSAISGHVQPRQGTEICNFGAPSPLEALHWIFCFFSSIYVQFSKTSPLKSGESSEKSSGENRVKSCGSNLDAQIASDLKFNPLAIWLRSALKSLRFQLRFLRCLVNLLLTN